MLRSGRTGHRSTGAWRSWLLLRNRQFLMLRIRRKKINATFLGLFVFIGGELLRLLFFGRKLGLIHFPFTILFFVCHGQASVFEINSTSIGLINGV
jgi:hypothetical protein